MFSTRTLKTLAILLVGYVLLAVPAYLGPSMLEAMSAYLVVLPFLLAWGLARQSARRRVD